MKTIEGIFASGDERIELPFGVVIESPLNISKTKDRILIEITKFPISYGIFGEEGIRQVNYLSMAPGLIAGNHYHKEKTEMFYVTKGDCLFCFVDPETEQKYIFNLSENTNFIVKQNVKHAIANPVIDDYLNIIEMANISHDPNKKSDSYKCDPQILTMEDINSSPASGR